MNGSLGTPRSDAIEMSRPVIAMLTVEPYCGSSPMRNTPLTNAVLSPTLTCVSPMVNCPMAGSHCTSAMDVATG